MKKNETRVARRGLPGITRPIDVDEHYWRHRLTHRWGLYIDHLPWVYVADLTFSHEMPQPRAIEEFWSFMQDFEGWTKPRYIPWPASFRAIGGARMRYVVAAHGGNHHPTHLHALLAGDGLPSAHDLSGSWGHGPATITPYEPGSWASFEVRQLLATGNEFGMSYDLKCIMTSRTQ